MLGERDEQVRESLWVTVSVSRRDNIYNVCQCLRAEPHVILG